MEETLLSIQVSGSPSSEQSYSSLFQFFQKMQRENDSLKVLYSSASIELRSGTFLNPVPRCPSVPWYPQLDSQTQAWPKTHLQWPPRQHLAGDA